MTVATTRRALLCAVGALIIGTSAVFAQDKIKLRLSSVNTETDSRAIGLIEKFGPGVAGFAECQPHWNGALFKQGTELEAIARGNLEMSIGSAQELSSFFPEFTILTAGYVHQSAEHQVAVFNDPIMDPLKAKVEAELGVKLLTVMYLGKRQINLKGDKEIKTPADMAGIKLRMPGSDAWQFLGGALGASPVPVAFPELYTALQTGAVDGQDNPLPTVIDSKFYEVTNQIVMTSHLVDLNYLTISKAVWDGLSADQQAAVQAAADAAAEHARQLQLQKETEAVAFLTEKGLKVYEPDVAACREAAQAAYLASDYAKDWPAGMLDRINELAK